VNAFTYEEMTTRNMGFVTPDEQAKLRAAHVFIPGVGGMGGAAFMTLVRAGIGHFTIADIDTFEVSNLNRQVFAFTDTVDRKKADAAAEGALKINPQLDLKVLGAEWLDQIETLAATHKIIINGTDDTRAGVRMYRVASEKGATIIDAYAATLPSVYVVKPHDPRPEERMGYPTVGKDWTAVTPEIAQECLMKELEWGLTHSSMYKYVDLPIAAELAAGKRKRFSFAPMVIATGTMMAYEAIRLILGKDGGADHRGHFFNPHLGRVEKPLPWPLSAAKGVAVRAMMKSMMGGA
jgi:molybdopterin/thiamine biosynthesis adenylyltransferase